MPEATISVKVACKVNSWDGSNVLNMHRYPLHTSVPMPRSIHNISAAILSHYEAPANRWHIAVFGISTS